MAGGRALAALALAAAAGACVPRAVVPLRTIAHPAGAAPSKTLVVLLPGRFDDAEDFDGRGFVVAAREGGLDADLVAVDAHIGYYANAEIARRLHEDVVVPARKRGVTTIWAVGISLGGLGAIMSLERYPGDLDGALLIAPFLGDARAAAHVNAAGGLALWKPPATIDAATDPGIRIWSILKREVASGRPLWLGFGADDSMAPAHRTLAEALPADHVVAVPGPHDWPPWLEVWKRFLASGPIARRPFTPVSHGK